MIWHSSMASDKVLRILVDNKLSLSKKSNVTPQKKKKRKKRERKRKEREWERETMCDIEIVCDIVIYNKKYIFGLCPPVSGTELLKPL